MLGEQEFQHHADAALAGLYEALAAAAENFDFDVEMNQGALTVEFEAPRERFVVSPNSPVRQIWVSANVQSYKLDWNEARASFVLAATGQALLELMAEAIGRRLPEFEL